MRLRRLAERFWPTTLILTAICAFSVQTFGQQNESDPKRAELFPIGDGSTNPRAGQPAFSGADGGSLKASWGKSIVDLTRYAHSGDRIRLRWDLSTDFCFGTNSGWYLDNVLVYACRP